MYKKALAEADRNASKAFDLGWNTSAYAGQVAQRFFNARAYGLAQDWLVKVLRSRDKNIAVISRFLGSKDFKTVATTIRVLGVAGKKELAGRIANIALKSDIFSVRMESYVALGKIADPAAVAVLYRRFASRRQPFPVKEEEALYGMLAAVRDPRYLSFLMNRFRAIPSERKGKEVRASLQLALFSAIIGIEHQDTIRFVERAWQNRVPLRSKMARLLKKSGQAGLRPFILRALPRANQDQYLSLVRAYAAIGFDLAALPVYRQAWGRFAEYGVSPSPLVPGLKSLPAETIKTELIKIFQKKKLDFNTLAATVQLAAGQKDAGLAPLVHIRIAADQSDLQQLSLLIDLLGDLGNKQSVGILKPFLKHDAPGIRLLAATALKKLTGKTYQYKGFDS